MTISGRWSPTRGAPGATVWRPMPRSIGLAGASAGYRIPTVIGAPRGSATWTTLKPAVPARAGVARPARVRMAAEARKSERIDMDVPDE